MLNTIEEDKILTVANLKGRRQTTTFEVGPFTVAVSFVQVEIDDSSIMRVPVEVFFTKRGNKAGESQLDDYLYELGVKISREMQSKNYNEEI